MRIGFHTNQLCERGTSVAMFDYAYHCREMFGAECFIFYDATSPFNVQESVHRFMRFFGCYGYREFDEVEKISLMIRLDLMYFIKSGEDDGKLVRCCRSVVHAVFCDEPHGDIYAVISEQIRRSSAIVPHMVSLPKEGITPMRRSLGIPANAIVLGRHGGYDTFDDPVVKIGIMHILEEDPGMWIVFVNTEPFHHHERIIYLDKIVEPIEKSAFILSCDAMIYGRTQDETFGLAIAEFSCLGRPIIINRVYDGYHKKILGPENAIYFNGTPDDLIHTLRNIRQLISYKPDWTNYLQFNPQDVMSTFHDVFIQGP